MSPKPCATCGAEFTPSCRHARYCSDVCRQEANRVRARARYVPKKTIFEATRLREELESLGVKRCSCCKQLKEVSDFYVSRRQSKKSKLYSQCKACHIAHTLRWRNEHIEAMRLRQEVYSRRHAVKRKRESVEAAE